MLILWSILIGGIIALALVIRAIVSWYRMVFPAITIYDYQRGLLYHNGGFERVLEAGRHATRQKSDVVHIVDLREHLVVIGGQEVLTSDMLAVKVTATLRVKITEPRLAQERAQNALELVYSGGQAALRRSASRRPLDQLLADRTEITHELTTDLTPELTNVGYALVAVDIRDFMLTSDTKKAFSDTFRARKEGEAALERARGETAALRSLANAGRMLKDNPGLLQVRTLQVLQNSAQKGATLVLNMSPTGAPLGTDHAPASEPTA